MSTNLMTFGGEARSGKGTSVSAIEQRLVEANHNVKVIDQGLKFRALAELALGQRVDMNDSTDLTEFVGAHQTRQDMLGLLGTLGDMSKENVRAFLYRPAVSKASAQVGKIPFAHDIAIKLLHDEVKAGVENEFDTLLIDGRAMEKYGRKFTQEGMGNFVMGWYFRCDAAIAARRSLGLFVDHENMDTAQKVHLLAEIIAISDRNRSDALRPVDPMREPASAHMLDLSALGEPGALLYHGLAVDAQKSGMVVVNTSYTKDVREMVDPVVGISLNALHLRGGPNLTPMHPDVSTDI